MTKKISNVILVKKLLEDNPKLKVDQVMTTLGIGRSYSYALIARAKRALKRKEDIVRKQNIDIIKNHYGSLKRARVDASIEAVKKADMVNHPAHYKVGGIETIDFIEAKKLNYNLGNVVKYITRADHKGDRKEDLLKARWYLNREIANLGQ